MTPPRTSMTPLALAASKRKPRPRKPGYNPPSFLQQIANGVPFNRSNAYDQMSRMINAQYLSGLGGGLSSIG